MISTNAINYVKSQFAKMYTDTAKVYRYVKTSTPSGATREGTQLIYTAIPCRISQKELNSPLQSQTSISMNISYEIKLFCSPDYILKAGDKLEVTRGNNTIQFYELGKPFQYSTHQEFLLSVIDRV